METSVLLSGNWTSGGEIRRIRVIVYVNFRGAEDRRRLYPVTRSRGLTGTLARGR